jgi:hypothetical protein
MVEVGSHCWQDKGSEDLIYARYEYFATNRNYSTIIVSGHYLK